MHLRSCVLLYNVDPPPPLRSLIALLPIAQAVFRPRNRFEPGRLNLASAVQALAIRARFDTPQGVLHLEQRPRRDGTFLQGLGYTLRGGGVIGGIPDFELARGARLLFDASDFREEFPLLFEQPLFEVFRVHSLMLR